MSTKDGMDSHSSWKTTLRSAVGFVVGVTIIRLALTGHHRQFVRAGMGPLLLIAGGVLVLLSVAALVVEPGTDQADRHDEDGPDHDHDGGHDHGGGHDHDGGHDQHRVSIGPGLLLLLPVLAVFLVAPPPLGSWGFQRVGRSASADNYKPLPASSRPVEIRLREVVGRSDAGGSSLRGRTLLLTGFVVPHRQGFALARYSIACCAADAQGAQVIVTGKPAPAADTWVRVTATYVRTADGEPVVNATSIETIPSPPEPFE